MSKDYKYALEIMKVELTNKFICPEIKYAFEASIELLEKQIPKDIKVDRNMLGTCPECGNILTQFHVNYCCSCGQKLQFTDG